MYILTNYLKNSSIVADGMIQVNKKITICSDLQGREHKMKWF